TFLMDERAELFTQRRVQQVRRRVIAARRVADVGVDFGSDDVASLERAARDSNVMRARHARAGLCEALDGRDSSARACDPAGVGHLPAGFEIERRLRERNVAGVAGAQLLNGLPFVVPHRDYRDACHLRRRIALERVSEFSAVLPILPFPPFLPNELRVRPAWLEPT